MLAVVMITKWNCLWIFPASLGVMTRNPPQDWLALIRSPLILSHCCFSKCHLVLLMDQKCLKMWMRKGSVQWQVGRGGGTRSPAPYMTKTNRDHTHLSNFFSWNNTQWVGLHFSKISEFGTGVEFFLWINCKSHIHIYSLLNITLCKLM